MKTKTRFHKLTAWLLTLAMLMTFIPTFSQIGTGLTVYATEGAGSDSDDSELGGGTGDGGSEAGSGGSSGTEGDGTAVSYLAPVYENGTTAAHPAACSLVSFPLTDTNIITILF